MSVISNKSLRFLKRITLIVFLLTELSFSVRAQVINETYVKALYKKYPTAKSNFCAACKIWKNPFYESIADTSRHLPLLTHYVYTKAHRIMQEALDLPRTGIYAKWHPVFGQVNEDDVYSEAADEINQPHTPFTINKGHCQPWIMLAWCADAAILSDSYTFNSAVEYAGQNVGTEIASEDTCRTLTGWNGARTISESLNVWCGTFGSQRTYSKNSVVNTVPAAYFKIIRYTDEMNQVKRICYWMPNQPTEKAALLGSRRITYAELKTKLGFDPEQTLP